MTSREQRFKEIFSRLADLSLPAAARVARPGNGDVSEEHIWESIQSNLRIQPGEIGLDIGCGCGSLAKKLCGLALLRGVGLTMVDFDRPISVLRDLLSEEELSVADLRPGSFPGEYRPSETFDFILLYSVIHYVDDPATMVDVAASLLRPGGRLFVGDIPNLSRKGRFLASDFGRAFESRVQRDRHQ